MHQLQCCCTSFTASSYSLRPVLTRSLRTVSSRQIRRRPKSLMGTSPNHIKFIKLRSRNSTQFSILWLQMCCVKKTYRKFKILHPSSVTFCCNHSRIQHTWLLSHKLKTETKDVFLSFPPTNEECAKLVGLPQERSSCTGDLYAHELKTCPVELTSCYCNSIVFSTQHPSSPLSRSCPQKCCILPTAVSGCFHSLLYLVWKLLP